MSDYYGHPPKCDCCGKFHKAENGAAWLRIPSCDIPGESGDERDRCAVCVGEFGPFTPSTKYRAEMVTGVYS